MLHHTKMIKISILSVLMLSASLLQSATPLQVSPPPPPDPILANQKTCLLSAFDPNLFTPVGLGSITWQFNSYLSPTIAVNPKNPKNLVVLLPRDEFFDSSGIYFGSYCDVLAAISKNGGKTWEVVPVEQELCLGGTVSQSIINSVFSLSFSKKGTLFYAGTFADTRPFDSHPKTRAGVFVKRSFDGGATWSGPIIIDTTNSSVFAEPIDEDGFVGGSGFLDDRDVAVLADPFDDCIVHALWDRTYYPSTFYGNFWYARSTDEAKTFSQPRLIYDMAYDPVWVAEHFNPRFPMGGQSLGVGFVSVPAGKKKKKCQVLLAGFIRIYPKKNSPVYTQQTADSLFDHCIVSSHDNGISWSKAAVALPQYTLAYSHDPTTGQPPSFSNVVSDGALNVPMAVSPKTKRVYLLSQNGNSAVNSDPAKNQFYPLIGLYRSNNKGKTWSNAVTVSRTPLNTNPTLIGANQSFNANIAILSNGLVGVIYSDFRNYNGSVVPNASLATDVWLALYQEVNDVDGGSTGVGLDFVEEVRLTPRSFNALIGFNSIIDGVGNATGIAAKGHGFVTTFGQTVQGSKPTQSGVDNAVLDPNNRLSVFFEKVKP